MNRRRFLSMLGAIPAALALPSLPALAAKTKRTGTTIVVRSPMNDFRSDLQRATYLVKANGGEMILPAKPRTPAERVVDAVFRLHQAFKDLEAAETDLGLPPNLPPYWWMDNQGG